MLKYTTWTETLPSGKYRRRTYYDSPVTGKKEKIGVVINKDTAQALRAADQALEERIQAIYDEYEQRQCAVDPDHLTLKALLDMYIADQKAMHLQDNTIRRNKSVLSAVIKLLGEDTDPEELTAGSIKSALTGKDISNTKRNGYLVRLKAMLRWASENDHLKNSSFTIKLKPFPEKSTREKVADKFLEPEELQLLLDNMVVEKWRLLTEFLVKSGLRIGEALALNDADVQKDIIVVNKTLDIETKERKDRTKTTTGTRNVDIQPDLAEVIKKIRRYVRLDKIRTGYRSSLFFPGDDGDFVTYYTYNKYLKENAEKVVPRVRVTPHVLRHTHVSLLAAQGVPLDVISRRVGHEGSDVTKSVYLHVTKKLKERDREVLMKVKIL